MVKAYQRYTPRITFGVVASGNSNIIYDAEGKYAVSPALEDVSIWDLKKGELVRNHLKRKKKKLIEFDYSGPLSDKGSRIVYIFRSEHGMIATIRQRLHASLAV
jgi:hypothetical protein